MKTKTVLFITLNICGVIIGFTASTLLSSRELYSLASGMVLGAAATCFIIYEEYIADFINRKLNRKE